MKVVILLAGFGSRMRPHTWSRPKPLLRVAGNTVVGHILDEMSAITTGEVIFVVGYKAEQIENWIRDNYPHLDAHFVHQEEALGQAHAVWLCRDHLLDESDVVIAFGDGIIKATFTSLPDPSVDGVLMVQEVEDPRRFGVAALDDQGFIKALIEKPHSMENRLALAGINWFRSSMQLMSAVDHVISQNRQTLGEFFMVDAYQVMLERGARLRTMLLDQWSDAGTPHAILRTNARLLSIDKASPDALERSYSEEFTVVPPVYIHPSASIERSVIGPYTTIDADVQVKNSVIQNSIIDRRAVLENCVLDGALIGEGADVKGRAKALFVGDDSSVELG